MLALPSASVLSIIETSRFNGVGKPRQAPSPPISGRHSRIIFSLVGLLAVLLGVCLSIADNFDGITKAQSTCDSSVSEPSIPGQPTNLSAPYANGIFVLSWQAPSDKGNPSLDGYRVRHDPTADVLTVPATATSRELTDWKGIGVAHTLSVAAYNCAGSSEFSSIDSVAAELPSAPRSFEVAIVGTFAVATWRAPDSTGSARNITGYTLSFQGGGSSNTVDLAQNAVEHIWSGMSPGTSYTFSIAAKTRYGTGTKATTTDSAPLPNDAPRSFTASYVNGGISLSWLAPTSALARRFQATS